MACWGRKIPRLAKLSLQFTFRSLGHHAAKKLLEAVGSSVQVFESWGSQWMREWSHTCIHQSLNMFAYLSYSTQRKWDNFSLF
jgi:hypothetical protein